MTMSISSHPGRRMTQDTSIALRSDGILQSSRMILRQYREGFHQRSKHCIGQGKRCRNSMMMRTSRHGTQETAVSLPCGGRTATEPSSACSASQTRRNTAASITSLDTTGMHSQAGQWNREGAFQSEAMSISILRKAGNSLADQIAVPWTIRSLMTERC